MSLHYEVAKWIERHTDFDQVILEFYTPGIPDSGWVHVTYNTEGNRKKSLTASKVGGKTHYSLGLKSMSNHPTWVTTAGAIGTFPSQVAMTFTFVATPIARQQQLHMQYLVVLFLQD